MVQAIITVDDHTNRVHIAEHFVLTFSVNEQTKTVVLEDYDHHDKSYNSFFSTCFLNLSPINFPLK